MIAPIRHWLAERLYQLAGRIEPRRPDLHEHVEGPEFVVLVQNPHGYTRVSTVEMASDDNTCGGAGGAGDTPAGHVGG